MEPIEIKFSKAKLRTGLIFCLLFAGFMFGMMYFLPSAIVVYVIFGSLGGLFLTIAVFMWGKLTSQEFALVIDEDGLIDHSTAVSIGRIEWADIEDFKLHGNPRMIAIMVGNANKYIQKQPNPFKRMIMRLNLKLDKSPIFITDQLLDISYEELVEMLKSRRQKGSSFPDLLEHLIDDE